MTVKPPRLATWLLERLDGSSAVVGDLVERYQRGRSSSWFWRQALSAIIHHTATDVRRHKFQSARAILVGFGTVWLLGDAGAVFLGRLGTVLTHGGYSMGPLTISLPYRWQFYFPWHWSASPLERYIFSVVAWCVVIAIAGWVVGRTHARSRFAMVAIFSLAMFAYNVPTLLSLSLAGNIWALSLAMYMVLASSVALLGGLGVGAWRRRIDRTAR
jgi:hypothetical protein